MFSTLCASPVVWRQKVPGSIQTCVVVCMMMRPCIVAEKLIWWGCNKALINLWPPDGLLQNQCSLQYTLYRWEMNVPLKKKKLMRNDCDADAWETGTEHMKFHWSGTTAASCRDWEPEVHISQWCASSPKKSFFTAMLAESLVTRLPRSLLHARRLWQCVARSSYGCLGYVVATQPFGIAKIIWGWANTPICFFFVK